MKILQELQPFMLAIISTVVGPLVTYRVASMKVKRDFHNDALQNRYYKIYVPLRTLLLETHITGVSRGYFFSQKIRKALHSFKKLKIKQGIKLLNRNYVTNQAYAVEFGREFPLDEIKKIVKEKGEWADATLLNLIQAADRAGYEKVTYSYTGKDNGLLETQKFELAQYIWDTYYKLNKRLVPPA